MWGLTSQSPDLIAVLTATMPLGLTLLSLLFLRRGIPRLGVVGLAISFGAAWLLASPSGSGINVLPLMVVALGTVAWAGGALPGSQSDVARRHSSSPASRCSWAGPYSWCWPSRSAKRAISSGRRRPPSPSPLRSCSACSAHQ